MIILRGIIFFFIVLAVELWAVSNFLESGQEWANKRKFDGKIAQISTHYSIEVEPIMIEMSNDNGPDLHKMARVNIIENSDDGFFYKSWTEFDCLKAQIKYSFTNIYDKDGHPAIDKPSDKKDSNAWYNVDGELRLVMDAACTQMKDVHWHPLVAYNIVKPKK
ncbi:MAG: hypothetical protein HY036_01770 [Nitrospirae bacterium]|nr:hypothetical protein [Nitrospirota bacterium]MBI3351284.1 hypothetical protein [Nitrospirota bacterium]